jgi:hypothetical protein
MSNLIQRQINAIASRARRLLLVHGICWFVVVAASVAMVLGGADYWLRFQDQGVRLILSTAFALTLMWSFWRFVVPAVQRRFSDLEVAASVERCFPQLDDRLSSSLAFLSLDSNTAQVESVALQQTVIATTERIVQPLDLSECLDHRAARRSLLACIPVVVVIGVICALDLQSTTLAARRLVVPWSQEEWPRWNSLEFVNPPVRIALGQEFTVELLDRRGRLPREATLQLWFDGDEEGEAETVAMERDRSRFRYALGSVSRSFKFRAAGGDDDSMEWHSMQVVEPATIERLQITITPPEYSGVVSTKLSGGPLLVLEGSQLTITGNASRAVQSVLLHVNVDDEVETIEANVDASRTEFTLAIPANTPAKGQYWIELIEADGVVSGNDSRASWKVIADHVPSVSVGTPAGEMYFTPGATVSIHMTATDDIAIQHVQLAFEDTEIPLFVAAAPPRRDTLPTHTDVHQVTHDLELRDFSLTDGDVFELVFTARDHKPQTSEPVSRLITIISHDEFDYRLQESQKRLLQLLLEARRLQQATRSQITSLRTQLEQVGSFSDGDVNLLRASEVQQQQVARLLSDSPGGATQLVTALVEAMASNRMSDSEMALQMRRLGKALNVLNHEGLPNLLSEFVRITKTDWKVADERTSELLASIAARQEAIGIELQAMIDLLSQWDDYRRFAQDVAKLLRDQQKQSASIHQLPTIGQRIESLSTQQRADLERAAVGQLDLARRLERLQSEMTELHNAIGNSDPSAAMALTSALRKATENSVTEQMRQIGEDVLRNRLGNATRKQQSVEDGLQQVLKALTSLTPNGSDQQDHSSNVNDESTARDSDHEPPPLNLEELRLVHAMQVELLERTIALEKLRFENTATEKENQAKVSRLATEQGKLAESLRKVIPTNDDVESQSDTNELESDLDRALNDAGIFDFGADETQQPPSSIDQRLLDRQETSNPLRGGSAVNSSGEDLGSVRRNTLSDLVRQMQQVRDRLRRSDTSPATTNLQNDIAMQLAKMLEAAEQQNASQATAHSANESPDKATQASEAETGGALGTHDGQSGDPDDELLDAIWGRLPDRLRQQIQSPLQGEFLPRYERVIQQYYKRLAEQQRRLRD